MLMLLPVVTNLENLQRFFPFLVFHSMGFILAVFTTIRNCLEPNFWTTVFDSISISGEPYELIIIVLKWNL
jgi:hypothetical protein